MSEHYRNLISLMLVLCVISLSAFVVHRFIPSLLWASIISMATYRLYKRWKDTVCYQNEVIAAASFTLIVSVVLIFPITWLATVLVHEAQIFINFLMVVNQKGYQAPDILNTIPFLGDELHYFWHSHFSEPGGLKKWLSNLEISLTPASYYLKELGVSLVKRSVQLGFTLMSLFFFYRDGEKLIQQVDNVGRECLGQRWSRLSVRLPQTLISTVNGTVLIGVGVGLLMGLSYTILGFPAPALAGFFTAIAAMIPFAVPFVFVIVAFVLWLSGSLLHAIIMLVIGTLVMFVADHFVKPVLIGGTTRLHFLAVLFGILGGVETLGLIGLFLGPMIMALFMIFWEELSLAGAKNRLD